MHRCTRAPFILYFASAKCPADSYSGRNKRCLSFFLYPPSSLSLSRYILRSLGRESRLRGSCCHTWPTTPLRSLRSGRFADASVGAFLFTRTHFLLSARERELCFSFLSSPLLPRDTILSRDPLGPCSRFFLSFFPLFLSFHPGT